jgi:hypothetical protein
LNQERGPGKKLDQQCSRSTLLTVAAEQLHPIKNIVLPLIL